MGKQMVSSPSKKRDKAKRTRKKKNKEMKRNVRPINQLQCMSCKTNYETSRETGILIVFFNIKDLPFILGLSVILSFFLKNLIFITFREIKMKQNH